jgi:hypothetical protein
MRHELITSATSNISAVVSIDAWNYVVRIPKRRDMGRPVHQPNRTMKGIQKSVYWMLKSMGRPLASLVYITVNMRIC